MGGLDKFNAMERLKSLGWTEAPELGPYHMRPPAGLVEKLRAGAFHVYDARDLQDSIDPEPTEDEQKSGPEKHPSSKV